MYILRLDDACEFMHQENWLRIETICDRFNIKPIIGVIPCCEDPMMKNKFPKNDRFWEMTESWLKKGWIPALHGFNHVYCSYCGGINPINKRSEFAGVPLEVQKQKISSGLSILKEHGISPTVFFAPGHTFDENTISALRDESEIRIISDTIASDVYIKDGFIYIPQQSGIVRKLPFKTVTFCYHPNTTTEEQFIKLEQFLEKHSSEFVPLSSIIQQRRKLSLYDRFLKIAYFTMRRIRH